MAHGPDSGLESSLQANGSSLGIAVLQIAFFQLPFWILSQDSTIGQGGKEGKSKREPQARGNTVLNVIVSLRPTYRHTQRSPTFCFPPIG